MAISPQRLTIYLYSAHRAVIFAIAQLSCITHLRLLAEYLNNKLAIQNRKQVQLKAVGTINPQIIHEEMKENVSGCFF